MMRGITSREALQKPAGSNKSEPKIRDLIAADALDRKIRLLAEPASAL